MRFLVWGLLLLAVLLFALSWTFIESKFVARRKRNDDQISIEIKGLWGLVKFRFNVPIINLVDMSKGVLFKNEKINENANKETSESSEAVNKRFVERYIHKMKIMLKNTSHLSVWIKKSLSRFECKSLQWHSRIGLDDAAVTATTVGIIWTIKSMLVGFCIGYVKMVGQTPQISVVPQYNTWDFSTEIEVEIKIRIIHLVEIGISLLFRILKEPKGIKTWKGVLFKRT